MSDTTLAEATPTVASAPMPSSDPASSKPSPSLIQACIVCGSELDISGKCARCEEARLGRDQFLSRVRAGEKPEAIRRSAPTFVWAKLVPLAVSMTGFGWILPLLLGTFTLNIVNHAHIIVAMLAIPAMILAFVGICNFCRPRSKGILDQSIQAFVFTGVVGVGFLLTMQPFLMQVYRDSVSLHTNVQNQFIMGLARVIGWSYLNLHNPNASLASKFIANVMAPGFCEELIKTIPLLYFVSKFRPDADWSSHYKGLLLVGFSSGLGFGIAEALSPQFSAWNGNNPSLGSQIVRWYSSVPLHALWGMCDVALLCVFLKRTNNGSHKHTLIFFPLAVLIMGLFHGLYDFVSEINVCLMPVVALISIRMSIWIVNLGALTFLSKASGTLEEERDSPTLVGLTNMVDKGTLSFGRIYTVCLVLVWLTFMIVNNSKH